jgi:hypothetical protein
MAYARRSSSFALAASSRRRLASRLGCSRSNFAAACRLPFVAADEGIAPAEAMECFNPNATVMRAEALSRRRGYVGAVAFSRTGNPAPGDFGDAKVIRKFGEVPDDLSAL